MNWKNTLGYGASVWAIIFVVISALVGFGVYNNTAAKVIIVLFIGCLAYWFASKSRITDWTKAIGLAVSWVIIAMVLDYAISMRFAPSLFSSRALWVGYALLAVGTLIGAMRKGGGERIV